jgi:D-alanine--poly(phosphoribitol) ligase subunit 1
MKFDFTSLDFTETSSDVDKLAFACSDKDLTWADLQKTTDTLCGFFGKFNPEKSPVLIYGSKEHLFPSAMLACIKSGIPYVAVDKIIPEERISFIIEATGACVLVNCFENPVDFNVPFIIQSDLSVVQKDVKIPGNKSIENGLCYILFTSGSTGSPKGVKISIDAVRSFVNWMIRTFPVDNKTVFINQATFSFDISLVEFLGTVSLGASAVLNSPEMTKENPSGFIDRIKKYNCNFWNSTPSFIYQYLMHPEFTSVNLPFLRTFLFMGEELPSKTVERIYNAFSESKVYNAYGPTEATVVTTFIEITKEINSAYSKSLPIGFPKYDGKILVLNESNDLSASGELIITGDHVANGYLNNPPLTAEKFFLHEGKRAYRTGDLGFYKDGMVFFEGRIDDQIKYNGYRIELDEINSSLYRIPGIIEAVTVPLKVGNTVKKIVAFIKIENQKKEELEQFKTEIRSGLLKSIPEYMIPSDFCVIDEFPVNSNHKIDRKELTQLYSKGAWI